MFDDESVTTMWLRCNDMFPAEKCIKTMLAIHVGNSRNRRGNTMKKFMIVGGAAVALVVAKDALPFHQPNVCFWPEHNKHGKYSDKLLRHMQQALAGTLERLGQRAGTG